MGSGRGGGTSGQVLVYHDMLGMTSHPHHKQFVPKFCKQFADVGESIRTGLSAYKAAVEDGSFPGKEFSPYSMSDSEEKVFLSMMEKDRVERLHKKEEMNKKLKDQDEYEQLQLYGDKN